jgi:methylase of polypeptide subunit release factors
MPLPDASRLATLPASVLGSLGDRLRSLGLEQAHAWIDANELADVELLFGPLRRARLRRSRDAASLALRMFTYHDPLDDREARAVLGDVSLEDLVAGGLLVREPAGVASPFVLSWSEQVYFFGDELSHGGDAIMSAGPMTLLLLRASWPPERVGSALDLGCGAGACALLLATMADSSLGSDVNERAASLGAANAALNRLGNVAFRTGDLYGAVDDQQFSAIVAQPPFLPQPEGTAAAAFLFGGARGDELPLRALADTPRHLAPGGRATMAIEWPILDGDDDVAARVRRAMPDSSVDLLVIEGEARTIDEACIADALTEHPEIGEAYAAAVERRSEHFARLGVHRLVDTMCVVRRRERGSGWTGTVHVAPLRHTRPTRAHVDALIDAHELAAGGFEAILSARVRLPTGTAFVQDDDRVLAHFPPGSLHATAVLEGSACDLLSVASESADVRAATQRLAQKYRQPLALVRERGVLAIADALRRGLLLVG